MEFTIVHTDMKASEIKPEETIKKYSNLMKKDVEIFFSGVDWTERKCPGCGSSEVRKSFEKLGFKFSSCLSCFTLYAEKTPSEADLHKFYTEAESRKFWFNEIWSQTLSARKEKVLAPLANWMERVLLSDSTDDKFEVALIGTTDYGLAQEWKGRGRNLDILDFHVPESESVGSLKELVKENLEDEQYDGAMLLQSLDRAVSPLAELDKVKKCLRKGGKLFITGILSTGMDNLVLGEHSDTLIPPDRLNSFSYEGLFSLLEGNGFTVTEFSTPGELDVENILREVKNSNIPGSDLFEYILSKRMESPLKKKLQDFLQENRLSSRARIVAVKN